MSTAGGCKRFKQNAWKKELCSNCYRPKEEHQESPPLPPPSLPVLHPSQGILLSVKSGGRKSKKKKSVSFPKEESEVIGYGGESGSEDDEVEDWRREEESGREDEVAGEEEKALERLTKSNTDYNSSLGGSPPPSHTTQLPLGTQQKQTIQVTIQPFGMDNRKSNLSKYLEEMPLITTKTPVKEIEEKVEEVRSPPPMSIMKTIVIENKPKEETRSNPEGRKTHLTRGNVITKNNGEQVKNKLYIMNGKCGRKDEEEKEEDERGCEVTVKVLKIVGEGVAESREMAGEPDGKADSDEPETPITPRLSFLHSTPTTQITVDTRIAGVENRGSSPPPVPASPPPSCTPPSTPSPSPPSSISSSSPLPAITPPLINTPLINPPLITPRPPPTASPPPRSKRPAPKPPVPDPIPRHHHHRRSSLNSDTSEKKKTRVRATLRKLLRFGSREEEPRSPDTDEPRPRPQIIHPLDLNKSAVQVLPHASFEKNSPTEIYASTNSIANYSTVGRPSKPPPPPRSESLNLMERLRPSPNSENNVYANLGEGRCGITPVKPERTGSLRERRLAAEEDVYECVGSSPPDNCPPPNSLNRPHSNSITEADIYYPYVTFQNGEYKTKMKRRERGVVHTTLEENYGAVVIANHEALSHLLNKIKNKKAEIPKDLEGIELKMSALDVDEDSLVRVGDWRFVNCKCRGVELSLGVGPPQLSLPDYIEPITHFTSTTDLSPNHHLYGEVAVLSRKRIERLSVHAARKVEPTEESLREAVHVLLQVVKLLLAAKDKVNTDNFIVLTSTHSSPRVVYLPTLGSEPVWRKDCLQEMVQRLIGGLPLGQVINSCQSLPEAESILEVWLWGPTVTLPQSSLTRWLDLERATFLQSLVCSAGTVDREHLAFLVTASPDYISQALRLIQQSTTP